MRELQIDFENGRTSPRGLTIALVAASLVLSVAVAGAYRDTRAQVDHWNDKVARLQNGTRTAQAVVPHAPGKETDTELKRAHEIVSRLALPWEQLFLAIETATPSNIALLGVEPNAQKHSVKLTGEGKDIHAVLAYVQQLEAQPVLRDVYLLDHGTPDADAERPARFVIEAMWETKS